MEIRAAREADIEQVLRLWEVAAGPTRLPSDKRVVLQLIERDTEALFVAFDGDRVVGTIITGWDGWRCHLYRLAVAADSRRRGVASALVAQSRERARSLGARRLDAIVDDENDLGRAFWAGVGFEEGGLHDRRWSSPV